VPTVAEAADLPGFASAGWQGWFMPAATPAPIVGRIRNEVARTIALPEVNQRLRGMAYEPVGSTPADFTAHFRAEVVKFTKIIADAKIAKQ
jgi:tripartite-type tricarboxylate transporter receptor subunit TctC